MRSNPLVSIITPFYNSEKYLPNFFKSIIDQTYPDLELILVNDGSLDHSDDVIDQYRNELDQRGIVLKYLKYTENHGQAFALNLGLKEFTGDYVTWIDSDDDMSPDCIETKVDFLEDNQCFDYCVCNTNYVEDKTGKLIKIGKPQVIQDRYEVFRSLTVNDNGYYVCGAYMVRAAFIIKHFKDREIFTGRGGQNAQMLIPCAWYGELGYIDKELYNYKVRSDSHSHSKDTPLKQIKQLENFEAILINTIDRLEDDKALKYIPEIKKKFARARFGYALDTYDTSVIKQYAGQLKQLGILTKHDKYLVFRFTNPVVQLVFPVNKNRDKNE